MTFWIITTFDAVSVTITTPTLYNSKKEQTEIIGVYRDQRKNQSAFIDEFAHTVLEKALRRVAITGDFNIDLNNHDINSPLLNLINSYGFVLYNNVPTRINVNKNGQKTKTCLDHMFIRNIDNVFVSIEENGFSDHRSLLTTAELHTAGSANSTQKTGRNTITYFNRKKFETLLERELWTELDFTSVDSSFESFVTIYNNLKATCFEKKEINIRK
jgi:hypothetical protein